MSQRSSQRRTARGASAAAAESNAAASSSAAPQPPAASAPAIPEAAAEMETDEAPEAPAAPSTARLPPTSTAPSDPKTYTPRKPQNHVKIMLATDNHVGYMEKDPVRGQDSINTFKEILEIARDRDVDFILLGGDLFHDNKPSRASMHGVMALLREYTLGDRPVSIELLSDPNHGSAEGYNFPAINYEDSNLNVAIPVFSIHGNHDDPQGVGFDGALSALDLLSVSGLVNYFGKVELPTLDETAGRSANRAGAALQEDGIRIMPVLLQKGDTRIALYGMGNIKDERMHFELRANRVRMFRPAEEPASWFNILAIHQNRVAHDPKAVVPETMFDDSIHLVVWGHEHEQLIQPQPVVEKRYEITQPGSSIATSLSPGEAAEKKVAIIHVEDRDYMLEEIPLMTVRPFVMDDIDLDDELGDAGIEPDDKVGVTKLLKSNIYEMIERAKEEWEARRTGLTPEQLERMGKMPLPLIRLRVTYTKHEMGNLVRFGQEFVDKIANPKDVLQFTKKKQYGANRKDKDSNMREYVDPEDLRDMAPSEKLEKVQVGDLVREYLEAQELNILNPIGLNKAVLSFVDKDDRDAIKSFVAKMLKDNNKDLVMMNPNEQELQDELNRIRDDMQRVGKDAAGKGDAAAEGDDDDDEEEEAPATSKGKAAARGRRAAAPADSDDSMLDDFDGDSMGGSSRAPSPAKKGRAPAKKSTAASSSKAAASSSKAPARGKAKAKATFLGGDDEDEDSDDGFEVVSSTPAPSSRAAALMASSKPKKAPAKPEKAPAAPKASTSRATGSRTAARKATSRLSKNDDDDDDDEDEDDDVDEDSEDQFVPEKKTGRRR